MIKPKVKLVGITKNEACFLPEWVWHHLFFGFDAIDIYIDRSYDNSHAVIKKLKNCFSCINAFDTEWLYHINEFRINYSVLKNAIMSQSYNINKNDFDYMLFIDVNQFYIDIKHRTIQDYIIEMNFPDCMVLSTMIVKNNYARAIPLFKGGNFRVHYGTEDRVALRAGLKIKDMYITRPLLKEKGVVVSAAGRTFPPGQCYSKLKAESYASPDDNFILTDDRISSLIAVQSGNDVELIKEVVYPLSLNFPNGYYDGFSKLLRNDDIRVALSKGRIYIYLHYIDLIRKILNNELFGSDVDADVNRQRLQCAMRSAYRRLCFLDSRYAGIDIDSIDEAKSMIAGSGLQVVDKLTKAYTIFPFAIDQYGDPTYLKELVRYLVNNKKFDVAKHLLESDDNYSLEAFGKDWAIILFARAYEQAGMKDEAIKYYRRLMYSGKKEAIRAVARLTEQA